MAWLASIASQPLQCRDGAQMDALPSPLVTPSPNGHRAPHATVPRKSSRLFSVLREGVDTLNGAVLYARDGLTSAERRAQHRRAERLQILEARLQNAATAHEWRATAKELDIFLGHEAWKAQTDTSIPGFDAALIETELKRLDEARHARDGGAMLHLIRTSLCRNLGGMDDVRLYTHAYVGTKNLVDRYVDSTVETIRVLVDMSRHGSLPGFDVRDVHDQVVHARQAFGRSALLISGGATFGMKHVGVLKALFEAKLLPRIISGASAGSIVCAVLCTRTDAELPATLADFPYGDLAVFEEAGKAEPVLDRVRRLCTRGAWIDIKHLTRVMRTMLGDLTFQEAYNRTRRILNIPVSSASIYELPRLLNYVTAPNVLIWSAVAASCSVPLLFSAAELLVKSPATGAHTPWNPTPQGWIDGSVDNDLPMTRLAEMFNVNHFIVSQVNPHVVPFIATDSAIEAQLARDDSNIGSAGWVHSLTRLAKSEALHRLHVLAEIGILPNLATKCRSVLSQKYSGDITILPDIDYKDFGRILTNPDVDFMLQACLCGERATWPKLSRIRNHCAIELELDAAVQQLRAQVVFSPSQTDLRRMTTGSYVRTPSLPKSAGVKKSPFFPDAGMCRDRQDDSSSDDDDLVRIRSRQPTSHNSTLARPRLVSARSFRSTLPLSKPSRNVSSPSISPCPPYHAYPVAAKPASSPRHATVKPLPSRRYPAPTLVADDTDEGVDCEMDSHGSPDLELDDDEDEEEDEQSHGLGLEIPLLDTKGLKRNPEEVADGADALTGRDWFSHSQPVTGGRDWVEATTSPLTKKSRAEALHGLI